MHQNDASTYPQTGWGEALGNFFDCEIQKFCFSSLPLIPTKTTNAFLLFAFISYAVYSLRICEEDKKKRWQRKK